MVSSLRLVKRCLVLLGVALGVALVPLGPALGFIVLPFDEVALLQSDGGVEVLARDGTVLATGRNREGARSLPLSTVDELPPLLVAAFVAVEDRRFFDHHGVDVRGIARAVKDSVKAGRIVSGASTLTQQLARRLGKRGSPGLVGKVEEGLWALRLDLHVEKTTLLRAYLDRVPLGRNTVGVDAAAQVFFGRRAALLSPAQAALLAGMAHAPEHEDPLKNPNPARARRNGVLLRMRDAGSIDDEVYGRAVNDTLPTAREPDEAMLAPHLATRLRSEMRPGVGVVQTTLDTGLQRAVETILQEEILRGPHREDGLQHAAVVVVDNHSGEVLAWAGSADFDDDATLGKNDGVIARRQPGSALKPFVYGRALEGGMTAATVLEDVDTAFAVKDGGLYSPQNYDKRLHGPVTLRAALQNSYNIPAIQVARSLGAEAVLDVLHGAGFASLDEAAEHYGIGLVLGNGEVTLLEMAAAYRGLARGGRSGALVVVRGDNAAPASQRFMSEQTAALLTHILSDDAARAPAFGLDNALDLPFPVAAKTGTSRSYVDNWTAGFTHERTVAVWAGSFDGTPMHGVSGITGAGVVFRRVMERAMAGIDPAPLVDEATFDKARICPLSGQLAGPSCPFVDEIFVTRSAPTDACGVHQHDGSLVLSPALAAWAAREGWPVAANTKAAMTNAATNAAATSGLLSPQDGDVYAWEPGLPDGQEIPLRTRGVARVVVNGKDHDAVGWLALGRGHHVVVAYDSDGHVVDEARFSVR